MQALQTLIDKASKVCGSDTELARRLGIHKTLISHMRSGNRNVTPETAAKLAEILGGDTRLAAVNAVIASSKNRRVRKMLQQPLMLPIPH